MASRSTLVNFINSTPHDLQLINASLSHGVWTSNSYPPTEIKAGEKATMQKEHKPA